MPARPGHKEFIPENGGENDLLACSSISEEGTADLRGGEKVASSSLEVEEGGEGVVDSSEKKNRLLVEDLSSKGLVNKENPKEKNLGKRLVVKPLPSKSVGEVASLDEENDLEKFDKLQRVLKGRVGSSGKGLASKALRKEHLQVEEEFAPKKRRLASQGKLKEGDRLKVNCLNVN